MGSFVSKLNVKLLVIHFVAFWLFIFGFRTLAFLYDFNFGVCLPLEARLNDVRRADFDMKIVAQAGLVGAIVGYVISWRISLKHNWFWLNSVLIFVLIYVLKLYDLLGWKQLHYIFLAPGAMFKLNTRSYYIINGVVMLAIGSFLLFSGKIRRFIDRGNTGKAVKKPAGVKTAKAR